EPQPVKNIDDLPSIPDGWCWVNLDTLCLSVQNGIYLHKSLYGSGIPILRIDDFQNDFSYSASEFQLVNAEDQDIEKYSLNINDLIVNRVNSMTHLGKCLVITKKHLPAIFESNMMRIKLTEFCQVFFIAFYLRSTVGRRFLITNAKWAVNQASINQSDVCQTLIPFAPLEEQKEIVKKLEKMMKFADQVEERVKEAEEKLNKFNQSVLAKAFRGKLVPQDPNDETASVLLGKIQQEKNKTTEKKTKK
ncbi:MAG: restriction endonuclease subunit S, partial [Microcoleaceae cyanobacterium]